MISDMSLWLKLLMAIVVAAVVSFLMTPPVKRFAEKVGAIDIPKDERRVHDHPIPRMGGLAIFIGFVLSLLIFVDVSTPVLGILLGALIIVVMGAIDDIVNLNAWIKLAGQIVAAVVAIRCGIVFDAISNPNPFSEQTTFVLASYLPIPLTILWIVGCTNAVNLIDGLDGLAVGVSTISSLTMLVVALFMLLSAGVSLVSHTDSGYYPLLLSALLTALLGALMMAVKNRAVAVVSAGSAQARVGRRPAARSAHKPQQARVNAAIPARAGRKVPWCGNSRGAASVPQKTAQRAFCVLVGERPAAAAAAMRSESRTLAISARGVRANQPSTATQALAFQAAGKRRRRQALAAANRARTLGSWGRSVSLPSGAWRTSAS